MSDLNKLTPEQFVAWCMAELEERGFDTQKGWYKTNPPVRVAEGNTVSLEAGAVKELQNVPEYYSRTYVIGWGRTK